MVNETAKQCWSYWNCPEEVKKGCKAFKYEKGDCCWNVTDFMRGCNPANENKAGSCLECSFFKKMNP